MGRCLIQPPSGRQSDRLHGGGDQVSFEEYLALAAWPDNLMLLITKMHRLPETVCLEVTLKP